MRVCFAGTFNVIHKGHRLLIDTARKIAGDYGMISIGITTGRLIQNKKYKIPYEKREQQLKKYLAEKHITNYEIIPIDHEDGLAVEGSYDVIIVSPETKKNARVINEKRKEKKTPPLKIITIPHVLAEDGKPISSTRILNNDIDLEGNMIKKEEKGI